MYELYVLRLLELCELLNSVLVMMVVHSKRHITCNSHTGDLS